jgi:predicted outer membrane repeat protein
MRVGLLSFQAVVRRASRFVAAVVCLLGLVRGVAGQTMTFVPTWTALSPATSPPARYLANMAYDAASGQLILFGGNDNGTYLNDTWTWNGTSWTQLSPTSSPPPRVYGNMVYDAATGQLVLFSGVAMSGSYLADTWTWNGTNWTQQSPATSPAGRLGAQMAYDAATGQVVLFGGQTVSGGVQNDTWVWNGSTWASKTVASPPLVNELATMSYDAVTGQVVLFGGGRSGNPYVNDTLNWNGTSWTQQSPSSSPPARNSSTMTYDNATGQVVLFGGAASSGSLNDTWTWDGSNWTQQSVVASPSARSESSMAFDPATGQIVLFGGVSGRTSLGDTQVLQLGAVNLGTANVCATGASTPSPCSQTATLTFQAGTSAVAVGSVNALTQGAANLDFTTTATTCSGTIAANGSCTVTVQFAPQYAGPRNGAVTLTSSSGAVLGSVLIHGIGTGPQAVLSPPYVTINSLGGGFANPQGVATDGAGNVYVADNAASRVSKIPLGCTTASCVTTLGGGFQNPTAVAVDGAGNVYVADGGNHAVKKVAAGCTSSSCVTTLGSGFTTPNGVAVDGAGNVYVTDGNGNTLTEIAAGCTSSFCLTTLGGGFHNPSGAAVDAAGDVYVADAGNNALKVVPTGCMSSSCVTTLGGGFYTPANPAVDSAGNVYVADQNNSAVKQVPPGCTSSSCVVTLGRNFSHPTGVALDGAGNIYVADYANAAVKEIVQASAPTVTFTTATNDGSTDTTDGTQTVTLGNVGNAPLVFAIPGTGKNPSISTGFTLTTTGAAVCPSLTTSATTTGTLAVASSCTLPIGFAPVSPQSGVVNGQLVLTDNSPGGSQTISLSGTAVPLTTTVPTVTGVSPTNGSAAGGTTVTITGTNLSGASSVQFESQAVSVFSVNGAGTQITVTSPPGTGSPSVDVTVTTPGGTSAMSRNDIFVYVQPPITSVSPNSGPTNGGTRVTITGSSMNYVQTVDFGANSGTIVGTPTAASLTAISPASSVPGAVTIVVTSVYGPGPINSAAQFTYTTPVVVSSATTTVLAITSGGSAATTVAPGSAVTLTATVTAGGAAVTAGQVSFCDVTLASGCSFLHLLGTAQLTSAGTATFRFVPGTGVHSYAAVFLPTAADKTSNSATGSLTVTGTASTTTIAQSGSVGNYTLTGTVTGTGPAFPSGTLSFLDTSASNASLATGTLTAGTSTLSFTNSASPATGTNPYAGVVADFNGDGIADIATANTGSNTLTILQGNGDGTFTALASPATGNKPQTVAAGDFNGDGIVDLVAGNYTDSTLTILLGKGDGTFTAVSATPSTGNGPKSIAVADFNGDGIADIAVANLGGSSVTVLLGKGDGTFTAAATVSVGSGSISLVAADFNGDGIVDLATANQYANTVTILQGKGDGTFTALASPAVGNTPEWMTAGDFNGDGIVDLAVANYTDKNVNILLGKGDGTFTALASPSAGSNALSVAVGDFNGDGIADLAAVTAANQIAYLQGKGDGTFQTAVTVSTGAYPVYVGAADFNGDGVADIVTANYNSGSATVLLAKFVTKSTAQATGVSPVTAGTHNVEASFPGDSHYLGSVSGTTALTGSAPTVALITPTSGLASGGTVVTITGTAFSSGATVKFGSAAATGVTVVSASSITAMSPAGAGTVDVTVTTSGGTSAVSANDQFTYLAALPVFSAANSTLTGPSLAVAGSTVPVTATVLDSNKNPIVGATVTFGQTISGGAASTTANFSSATATTNASGVATTTLSDYAVETLTVTATASGTVLTGGGAIAQTPSVQFVAPAYIVTVNTDEASGSGTAANCVDPNISTGGNTNCGLRDAVAAANALRGVTTNISFAGSAVGTVGNPAVILIAQSTPIRILASMNLVGPGAGLLTVEGGIAPYNGTTQTANYQIFSFINGPIGSNAGDNRISGMTLANGYTSGNGGAIYWQISGSNLYLTNCVFIGNQAGSGGAVNVHVASTVTVAGSSFIDNQAGDGGAIYMPGGSNLFVNGSTFTGNQAGTDGGALESVQGVITVFGSTFIGNQAGTSGGAIYAAEIGLTVSNSTFVQNQATTGGALWEPNSPQVNNSTFMGNRATQSGSAIQFEEDLNSQGNIFVSNPSGATAVYGRYVKGTSDHDLYFGGDSCTLCTTTNAISGDPKLSALGSYGGTTQTLLPLLGSAAICAGVSTGSTTDQRGVAIPATYGGTSCYDVGAVQTSYALRFSTQPSDVSTGVAMSPAPVTTLVEDGSNFFAAAIAVTDADSSLASSPASATSSASNGQASFGGLVFNTAETADTLTASLPLNAGLTPALNLTATSQPFNIAATFVAPTVTGISPASGLKAGGTPVTITGTGFLSGATVNFGSVPATGVTVVSASSITATSPAGTGTVDVTVTTAGGTSATSAADKFTYVAPAATHFSVSAPSTATAGSAISVVVRALDASSNTVPSYGDTVTFSSTDSAAVLPANVTLSNGTGSVNVTLNTPGTQTVTATDAATASISGVSGSIVVSGIMPTIAFSVPNHIFGDAPFAVSASSNSTGAITYSVVSGPATISGSTVTLTGAGSVTLQASQAAAGIYAAGTQTASFLVGLGTAAITFSVPNHTYGDSPFAVSASSASSGAFSYAVVSGPASISGSTVTLTGAGSVTLKASQAADSNYAANSQTATFVVSSAVPTITFNVPNHIFGDAPFTVSATSNSVGAITYSVVSGPATISGSTVTLTGAGSVVLQASQVAAGNYAAGTQNAMFTVASPSDPTITFSVPNHTFGDAPFTVAATSNSSGAITYAVVSGPATISGSTVTLTGAGTVVLQANQAAAGTYAAGMQRASFVVSAGIDTISFSVPNHTYGDAPFTVSATSNSSGAFTYSIVSGPATISGKTVTLTGSGTVFVQASQAAAGNYAAGSQTASFTVAAATTAITFTVPGHTYGDAPFAVSASSASPGSFTFSVVSGPATISGNTVTLTGAGTVVLLATQAASGSYAAGSQTASFVVSAAAPTITFSIPNHTYGDAPFTVAASSNSSGAFTYSVVSGPATISGSTVTLTGVGTVTLQAAQAASLPYVAGTQTTTFTVAKAAQSISFAAPATPVNLGIAPITLSASATSGLGVVFSVLSGPATVSGSTLSINGIGTVVVAADQPGNANYNPATEVTHAITVLGRIPSLMISATPNPVFVQNPVTLSTTVTSQFGAPTGSVTFLDGTVPLATVPLVAGGASLTLSTLSVGLHSITVSYSGDANFVAAVSQSVAEQVQDFSVAFGASTVTISHGGTAVYNLNLTALGGATMPAGITFTIAGAPDHSEIVFSPRMVAAGGGSTNLTLTIQTPDYPVGPFSRLEGHTPRAILAFSLLGALLLPFGRRRRRLRGRFVGLGRLMFLLAFAASLAGLTGCGSGWGTQRYNMTVTATSGTLSHTANATLVSQ